jgi:hypothetical protein
VAGSLNLMGLWCTSLAHEMPRLNKKYGIESITLSVACILMTCRPIVNPNAAQWPDSLRD